MVKCFLLSGSIATGFWGFLLLLFFLKSLLCIWSLLLCSIATGWLFFFFFPLKVCCAFGLYFWNKMNNFRGLFFPDFCEDWLKKKKEKHIFFLYILLLFLHCFQKTGVFQPNLYERKYLWSGISQNIYLPGKNFTIMCDIIKLKWKETERKKGTMYLGHTLRECGLKTSIRIEDQSLLS